MHRYRHTHRHIHIHRRRHIHIYIHIRNTHIKEAELANNDTHCTLTYSRKYTHIYNVYTYTYTMYTYIQLRTSKKLSLQTMTHIAHSHTRINIFSYIQRIYIHIHNVYIHTTTHIKESELANNGTYCTLTYSRKFILIYTTYIHTHTQYIHAYNYAYQRS